MQASPVSNFRTCQPPREKLQPPCSLSSGLMGSQINRLLPDPTEYLSLSFIQLNPELK